MSKLFESQELLRTIKKLPDGKNNEYLQMLTEAYNVKKNNSI